MLARQRGRQAEAAAYANYPRQYVARRGTPPVIDGDLLKACWQSAPWSEPFADIRGQRDAPEGAQPTGKQATRMKMLWDDEYLYIAAVLNYEVGDELVAEFTQRNSPIFHTDSDFEVFIDPAGCCHGYKELELNAINTVWNLMLDRPYADGGKELSGRVARPKERDYWEVKKQRTATRITRGGLKQFGSPAQWCCELALAHSDTLSAAPVEGPAPAPGRSWRINFSRVEKKGEVNWVWSPQVVWSPGERRYAGEVNMHLPDAWGYVLFADANGRVPGAPSPARWRDPSWPARRAAAAMYYAAKAFERSRGREPKSAEEVVQEGLLAGASLWGIDLSFARPATGPPRWLASATADGWEATVTDDRLLRVRPAWSGDAA